MNFGWVVGVAVGFLLPIWLSWRMLDNHRIERSDPTLPPEWRQTSREDYLQMAVALFVAVGISLFTIV